MPGAVGASGESGKIEITDEPAWNAAEAAYTAGRLDQAVDGYVKTLRTTTKPWLKTRVSVRLLDAAPKVGRYDAAIAAFLSLVRTDPARALVLRPPLPPEGESTYLDTALVESEKMLTDDASLTGEQRQALLGLQLDIARLRKDDGKADTLLQRLNQLAIGPAGANAPGAAAGGAEKRYADLKLTTARVALDRGQYQKVIEEIRVGRQAITDPAQHEEALFLLAQATEGLASDDPAGLKDAAIAYVRVASHYQDSPGNRFVPAALVRTAAVLEKLGETKMATDLYRQVAIQYTTRPEGRAAAEHAKRLAPGK